MTLKKRKAAKVQLQVYIPQPLFAELSRIVEKEETTKSSMVEDCLVRGLAKYARKSRKGATSSRRAET